MRADGGLLGKRRFDSLSIAEASAVLTRQDQTELRDRGHSTSSESSVHSQDGAHRRIGASHQRRGASATRAAARSSRALTAAAGHSDLLDDPHGDDDQQQQGARISPLLEPEPEPEPAALQLHRALRRLRKGTGRDKTFLETVQSPMTFYGGAPRTSRRQVASVLAGMLPVSEDPPAGMFDAGVSRLLHDGMNADEEEDDGHHPVTGNTQAFSFVTGLISAPHSPAGSAPVSSDLGLSDLLAAFTPPAPASRAAGTPPVADIITASSRLTPFGHASAGASAAEPSSGTRSTRASTARLPVSQA